MDTSAEHAPVDARPLNGQHSRLWDLSVPVATEDGYAALFRKAAELCELAAPSSVDVTGLWWGGEDDDQLHLGLVLHDWTPGQ